MRKMGREERLEREGGGGVGEGKETEDGKYNKSIELSKPFFVCYGCLAVHGQVEYVASQ